MIFAENEREGDWHACPIAWRSQLTIALTIVFSSPPRIEGEFGDLKRGLPITHYVMQCIPTTSKSTAQKLVTRPSIVMQSFCL
jgi:BarA-like signal transduction histidine kinase